MRAYAKQSDDESLFNHATRIKDRAIRRIGELLKRIEPAKNQHAKRAGGGGPPGSARRKAAEAAGISRDKAKQATRVASIPEPLFEKLVDDAEEPASAADPDPDADALR